MFQCNFKLVHTCNSTNFHKYLMTFHDDWMKLPCEYVNSLQTHIRIPLDNTFEESIEPAAVGCHFSRKDMLLAERTYCRMKLASNQQPCSRHHCNHTRQPNFPDNIMYLNERIFATLNNEYDSKLVYCLNGEWLEVFSLHSVLLPNSTHTHRARAVLTGKNLSQPRAFYCLPQSFCLPCTRPAVAAV